MATTAFDNRTSQTIGALTTDYLVDPSGSLPQILGEFPSMGTPTYYLPGLGTGTTAGAMSYFNTDGLGSVRQVANSSGKLTYAANFDPYGNPLEQYANGGSTNLGYTGAPSDPTGLIYLNSGFYNPTLGVSQGHNLLGINIPLTGNSIADDPLANTLDYGTNFNADLAAIEDPYKIAETCARSQACSIANVISKAFGAYQFARGVESNVNQDPIAFGAGVFFGFEQQTSIPLLADAEYAYDKVKSVFVGESSPSYDGILNDIENSTYKGLESLVRRNFNRNAFNIGQVPGEGLGIVFNLVTLADGIGSLSRLGIKGVGAAVDFFQNGGTLADVANGAKQSVLSLFGRAGGAADDAALADSAAADAGGGVSATCSFSKDTQVATDKGEIAIGDLKVGDKVLAYDPQTTKVALKAIDAVLVHLDFQLENLTIDGETLHTTPNHPFYTQDKGWVAAGNLTIGEGILKADGSYGKVQTVWVSDRAQLMYNLTVHDDHDYFVGGGQWLVHNDCREIDPEDGKPFNAKNLKLGVENVTKVEGGASAYENFGVARQTAADRVGLSGDVTTQDFLSEFGPREGTVVGRQSPDGLRGWRIDFDPNGFKGFHINYWDKTAGVARAIQLRGAIIIGNIPGEDIGDIYQSIWETYAIAVLRLQ